MSSEAPETPETTQAPEASNGYTRGIREGLMAPINALMSHPAGRIATLVGLLGAAGMMGKDLGRETGRQEGFDTARSCIEAVKGEQFSHANAFQRRFQPETGEPYIDLTDLKAVCREQIGLNIPGLLIIHSANQTFRNGTQVRIGDSIERIPVDVSELLRDYECSQPEGEETVY